MGVPFIKVSVIYFVVGVLMGMYMGITDQFSLFPHTLISIC